MSTTKTTFSKERVEIILQSIEDLVELRSILRKYSPDFIIKEQTDEKNINKLIKKVGKHLIPIFEEQGLCGQPEDQTHKGVELIESGAQILEKVGDNYLFVSSNTIKKKLKALGIEPNKIIATGGPITIDDLKSVNPNLNSAAIQGNEKRIENVYSELKNTVNSGKNVIFLMDPNDETDKMIGNRLAEIELKVGIKFLRLFIKSWQKI